MTTLLRFPYSPYLIHSTLRPGESRRASISVISESSEFAKPVSPLSGAFSQIVAVHEVCPNGDCYVNPLTDGVMIFLTVRGIAVWEVEKPNGQKGQHRPGSVVWITAALDGLELTETVEQNADWWVSYLLLRGIWAKRIGETLAISGGAWGEAGSARQRQLLEEIINLVFAQTEGWEWRFLGRCAELFGNLSASRNEVSPDTSLISRLESLISESPTARPTLAEMATWVGITPRQLLYRVRKATGEPLATWIRKQRIERACLLLANDQTVSQVAEQLGFANPYHFSRLFRQVTGLTPSAYREQTRLERVPLSRKLKNQD